MMRLFLWLYRPLIAFFALRTLPGRPHDPAAPEAGRWTRKETRALLSEIWRRVPAIQALADLPALPTVGNRHNVLLAVLTTTAYRTLVERGTPRDHAAQLVADLGWPLYAGGLRLILLPHRLLFWNPERRLERVIRALMIFPFSAPGAPGYEVEAFTDESGLHTHWRHCPPQTFVRTVVDRQGDLGDLEAFYRSWCLYDWPGADLLVDDGRTGHYTRLRTLSQGDSVCDMCWRSRPGPGAVEK